MRRLLCALLPYSVLCNGRVNSNFEKTYANRSSEFVRGGNLFGKDSSESEHDGIDAQS